MIHNSQPGLVLRSQGFYRRLLRVYPASHREEYGEAMVQLFSDLCRDAWRGQGWWGLVRLWSHILIEMIQTAFREHIYILQQRGEFMTRRQGMMLVTTSGLPLFLWLLLALVNPAFAGRLIAPDSSPAQPAGWILTAAILILVVASGVVQYRILSAGGATQGETFKQRLLLSLSMVFFVFPAILLVLMGPALVTILAWK